MANRLGLESVTIGALAKATNMSKSGLFAHFKSKAKLQVQILDYAGGRFGESEILPALKAKSGIPRIRTLVSNWIDFTATMSGGCIFVSASTEFSDRPGIVRDLAMNQQQVWVDSLRRMAKSAINVGDFKENADCEQFAFDLYSLLLGFFYYQQLLQGPDTKDRQKTALNQLLAIYR